MVHRIQNRNPGYSDFSTLHNSQSFNYSNAPTPTSGANALKVDEALPSSHEPKIDNESILDQNININSDLGAVENSMNHSEESLVLTEEVKDQVSESNGLENFGLADDEPNLFDGSEANNGSDDNNQENADNNFDEDDFEIPAFLRRQKS